MNNILYNSGNLALGIDTSLSSDVYREILNRLLDNRIVPGDFLNRRDVANELGVSVAPVLEAMLQLEIEGFLESIPRKGTIVKPIKKEDVYGQLIVREALECQGARLYCGEAVKRNERKLLEFSEILDTTDSDTIGHWKNEIQFHMLLLDLAECPALSREFLKAMRLGVFYQMNRVISETDRLKKQSHSKLVHDLKTPDADEAEKIIRSHLRSGKDYIFTRMEAKK